MNKKSNENYKIKNFIFACLTIVSFVLCLILGDDKEEKIYSVGIIFFTAVILFFLLNNKDILFLKTKWRILCCGFGTFLLVLNFATNIFNPHNTIFRHFQDDSEALVKNMLTARKAGITDTGKYGLGYFDTENKTISNYKSQFGLQGKIFQIFYKIPVKVIKAVLCFLLAAVFMSIVILIKKKYSLLLAFCFYITFLLSPWIVNFARNLYWVEFTWFVPMLLGLICSIYPENKRISMICYVGAFVSLFIKCLCGYEYITVIMLAMISFLLVDFFVSCANKDKNKMRILFKHILILGICAVLGFLAALLIHARIRGDRNIIDGLKSIYKNDVLRRTLGGNPANFPRKDLQDSINASIFSVLKRYFTFSAFGNIDQIISGIPWRCFLPMSILPILIFSYKRKLEDVLLYIVFFITCVSWFVLGKSHSYIHVTMNYVLWYFGFIQVCFYIELKFLFCIAIKCIKKFPALSKKIKECAEAD